VVQRLYHTLRAHLRAGSYEAGQLEGVEDKPDSPARQQALAATLAEYLAAHPGGRVLLMVEKRAGVAPGGHVTRRS
jgi:hypothetical protein